MILDHWRMRIPRNDVLMKYAQIFFSRSLSRKNIINELMDVNMADVIIMIIVVVIIHNK